MAKTHRAEDGILLWYCPGCKGGHGVPVVGNKAWGWNESLTSPTLTPSVLYYAHDATPPFKPQPQCHCFIRDGKIEFLGDCDHALAGLTVEMPDMDD